MYYYQIEEYEYFIQTEGILVVLVKF
jgi:hypothetical protein